MNSASIRPGFALAVFFAAFSASAIPVVSPSSVSATQDEYKHTVEIEYQLTGEPGIVTVDIQTNVSGNVWASIGGEHYQNMYGDVNRVITNTTTKSHVWWHPDIDWGDADPRPYNVRAVVTAWSTNSPPDYMAVDLMSMSNILFYANAGSVAGGVTNRKYKTEWLLMRKIPARGVVWRMGSPSDESGRQGGALGKAEAARLVILTNDYYLGVYELTQKQYYNIGDGQQSPSPSLLGKNAGGDFEIRPLENVNIASIRGNCGVGGEYSWPEKGHKVVFSSTNPKYYKLGYLRVKSGLMFDFPTSAQWEYACRAGTSGRFNDGTDSMDDVGWNSSNWNEDPAVTSNMTHAVGLKTPNAWGLYDMHGNVREYVLERFFYPEAEEGVTYVEPTIPEGTSNPVAGESYRHLTRGGCYDESQSYCRSATCTRVQNAMSKSGFRLWAPAAIPHYGKPVVFK